MHTHKNQKIFVDTAGTYNFNGTATACRPAELHSSRTPASDLRISCWAMPANLARDNYRISSPSPSTQSIVYAMDDWRINKRLTLNLGLRWEGLPHAYDTNNRMSNFYPNLYNPAKRRNSRLPPAAL